MTPRVYNKRRGDAPAGAVYVGRPTKWGNRYVVGKHGTQDECVALHKAWLEQVFGRDPDALRRLQAELRGKDLVCWCAPKACHADTLLHYANLSP